MPPVELHTASTAKSRARSTRYVMDLQTPEEHSLTPKENSPYVPNARRIKLAFAVVDGFILTETPQFQTVLDSLSFLAMTKLLPTLRHSEIDVDALRQTSGSQDYQDFRRRAIKFRVYTRVPLAEGTTLSKLLHVSDCSVAASNFIRGRFSFSALRSVILGNSLPADDTSSLDDFTIMKEDLTYVLQSASEGDFEVVSECLRLQQAIRSYWASIFGGSY